MEAVLAGREWRTVPLGDAGFEVWFGVTQKGKQVADSPPPEIARFWEERGKRERRGLR